MEYEYLYIKKYDKEKYDRKIFKTHDDLFSYLQQQGEKIFNNGFSSAEILLCRIEKKEELK